MTSEPNATDLDRIQDDLGAAISAFIDNEANAIRADLYAEALRWQAAIQHLQVALVAVERAIVAATADEDD